MLLPITGPITTICRALTLALFILGSGSAFTQERVLSEYVYKGEFRGMTITMTRELVHLGEDTYLLRATATNILGKINEHEYFSWSEANGITPQRYKYRQRVFGMRRERSIEFDWATQTAHAKIKGKSKSLNLSPGTLGPMTYQLQLRMDIAEGKLPDEYVFINRDKTKRYQFAVNDAISAQSAMSAVTHDSDIINVVRVNSKNDRSTELYFTPSKGYGLVALKQRDRGKTYELALTDYKVFMPLANTPLEFLISSSSTPDEGRPE